MSNYIKVSLSRENFDPALWERFQQHQKERHALLKVMQEAFMATERGKCFQAMGVSFANIGGRAIFRFGSLTPELSFEPKHKDFTRDDYPAALKLGEKTLNTLLNGKILTDAEKRELVKSIIPLPEAPDE